MQPLEVAINNTLRSEATSSNNITLKADTIKVLPFTTKVVTLPVLETIMLQLVDITRTLVLLVLPVRLDNLDCLVSL